MDKRNFDLELIGFHGFYETALGDYIEDSLNYDLENLHDSLSKLRVNEFKCWWTIDNKQFMEDVADVAMANFIKAGNDLLSDVFKLIPTNKHAKVSSPREYNFTTDRIFKQVVVNKEDYDKLVKFLISKKDLVKKVIEFHFTSYDGFTSFHPNTLDHWLNLKWDSLTDLQLSYLYHCALCVRLFESDYYREDSYGNTIGDIIDVYYYFVRELENNTYDDLEMNYNDYVDLGQYQKELRCALDKAGVVVSKQCEDVINDTLWALTSCRINENNELVRRAD